MQFKQLIVRYNNNNNNNNDDDDDDNNNNNNNNNNNTNNSFIFLSANDTLKKFFGKCRGGNVRVFKVSIENGMCMYS
jgi:hypothetical protein